MNFSLLPLHGQDGHGEVVLHLLTRILGAAIHKLVTKFPVIHVNMENNGKCYA